MSMIPTIGAGKPDSQPLANFAKKEAIELTPAEQRSVQIPYIYYWEDVVDGASVLMTMAFRWKNNNYGMSYPIEDNNFVKIDMLRKKLFAVVKESLDVIVHHGEKVLDSYGNINPKLVNEQEAVRFRFDPHWDRKVAAFNQLVRIKPITKKQAIKLKLLPKPQVNEYAISGNSAS